MGGGESGTCTWIVTADGELIIEPTAEGAIEGTLGAWGYQEEADPDEEVDYYPPWHQEDLVGSIKSVTFVGTVKAQTCESMFADFENATSINLSGLDTSAVQNMSYMFSGCTSLDATKLDTSKATLMEQMFTSCSSLKSLDVSKFKTSAVKSAVGMFQECSGLTSLDVSGFDMSNCFEERELEAEGETVETIKEHLLMGMFADCSSLTSLKLFDFAGSGMVIMQYTFGGCRSLKTLDLSGFDTSKAEYMMLQGTFAECSNLETIYVASNWNVSAAYGVIEETSEKIGTEGTFAGCEKLKGGNGTAYSEEHTDSTYACIDSASTPGYFTAVSLSKASVSLAKASYAYTGSALKPAVTVKCPTTRSRGEA